MNVLVTGGSGFIGAWVARALIEHGHTVVAFDRDSSTRRLEMILPAETVRQIAWYAGDLTCRDQIAEALRRHAITHCIHLAGLQVPACRANPIQGAAVNVLGTLALLEAAQEARLERVVYASSAAVYGPPPAGNDEPLAEHEHLCPSTHYGAFKLCNEHNARTFSEEHGLPTVGLRPWTVYGPGRDLGLTSEPTKAIKAAVLGRPFHISFGGRTDFQFVADVAAAFITPLIKPYRGPKVYNLRGTVASMAEFHQALAAAIPDASWLITFGSSQIPIVWNLSDAALERDYGPLPKTSLPEGIQQTAAIFQHLKQNGRLDTHDLDAPPSTATAGDV